MISFLIAAACVVFVLSLPISATKAGQTLRRWAGVLFLLALAPALFVGLIGAMGGSSGMPHAGTGAGGGVDVLGTAGAHSATAASPRVWASAMTAAITSESPREPPMPATKLWSTFNRSTGSCVR